MIIKLAASSIHIKPSHKGLLHEELGIPEGQPIPLSRIHEELAHTSNPAKRRRLNFALISKTKFSH